MQFHIDKSIPPKNPLVISLTNNELKIFRQRRWNRYYRTWRNEETITHYVEEEFLVWKKLAKEFLKLKIDPRNPVFGGKHPLLNLWKTIDKKWGDLFVDLSTDPILSKGNFYKLY